MRFPVRFAAKAWGLAWFAAVTNLHLSGAAVAGGLGSEAVLGKNPFNAFILSDAAVEDRDGDGAPDLWRQFHPGTSAIRSLTLREAGRTVSYEYDARGRLLRREEFQGARPSSVTWIEEGSGRRRVRILSRPDRGGRFTREETVWSRADGSLEGLVQSGGIRWSWGEGAGGLADSGRAAEPSAGSCQSSPSVSLPLREDAQAVLDRLQDRVVLDPSCEAGLSVSRQGASAKLAPAELRSRFLQVAEKGLRCLMDQGGDARKAAEEVMANALATPARPLRFACKLPPKMVNAPDEGDFDVMAYTDPFDSEQYPRISFRPSGMDEAVLDLTAFHEMLHLGGEGGRQSAHRSADARERETVIACAQCCMMPPGEVASASCRLCKGEFKEAPSKYATLFAGLELRQHRSWRAAKELKKAVLADPSNREAWELLALAVFQDREFSYLAESEQDLLLLLAATGKAEALRKAAKRGPSASQDLSPVRASAMTGDIRKLAQDALMRLKPYKDLSPDAAKSYFKFRASEMLLNLALDHCGPIGKAPARETGADLSDDAAMGAHCRRLLDDAGAGMSSAIDALKAGASDREPASGLSQGGSFSSDALDKMLAKTRRYEARIKCRAEGVSSALDCPGALTDEERARLLKKSGR